MTKLDKWEDKLLDLGKRNRLLNYKDSRTNTLDIILPDIKSIYERLTGELTSLEVFDIDGYIKKNKFGRISLTTLTDNVQALLKPNQIFVFNKESATNKVIKEIDKKSKETILERGINVLYVAVGFVWWKENSKSSIYYKAPLILIPITIKNESGLSPFIIEQTEDEVVVNPTLVYKLQSEYNIKLPLLEDNTNLNDYLLSVAKIVSTLGWKTTKETKIGMFSFLKMNMYLDLKTNSETILKNDNVLTLLGEKKATETPIIEDKEMVLHNVVDADSSQLEAIKFAKQGVSFVLQGPPGTGKSQTITNIIAECLADGKKVLFVSEKLAALQVVYNNLRKAELDDFCLELHSYKTNKKEIIAELNRVLFKPKSTISNKATEELEILKGAKQKLDEYTKLLHKPVPTINLSPYKVFCEVSNLDDVKEMEFIVKDIENKGLDHLNEAVELLEKYVEYTKSVGNYKKNEWYGYNYFDTSYSYQIALKKHLISVYNALIELKKLRKEIQGIIPVPLINVSEMEIIKDVFSKVSEMKFIHPSLFGKKSLEKLIDVSTNMRDLSSKIVNLRAEIDGLCDENIYNLDGNGLNARYQKLYNTALRGAKKEYREDNKQITLCLKEGIKLSYKRTVELTKSLKEYQKLLSIYTENEQYVSEVLGDFYKGYSTDFNYVIENANAILNYFGQGVDLTSLSNFFTKDLDKLKYQMAIWSKKLEMILELNEKHFKFIAKCFDSSIFNLYTEYLEKVIDKIAKCNNNIGLLENWVLFHKVLEKAKSIDLIDFIETAVSRNVKVETLPKLYALLFYKQWAYQIFSTNELLAEMDRVSHDKYVQLFDEKDKLMFEISKAQINAKLSALRPNVESTILDDQVAVLVREQEKQKHQMPVRVLLNKIPEIILKLKPCFLMSPLSVSTLLDSSIKFDVVIFDEASQIFPEDAIGAIYRAKQVIVVGDQKQMPPSNFFTATIGEDEFAEDYDEDVEDYESILDICGTSFTQNRLKWHYRSRTEDLIAFSNKNYYNNELVTFPSAIKKDKHFGVDFYYTAKGVFDRKTKTNIVEAEYVADLVVENLKKYPERSLGVVAFSQSQQEAIEKIIARKRDNSKQIDKLFSEDSREPFFVKNLETVQGDERDTIIFSIGYAKDATGKFYHNFGPLNRQGGERRLNVAVTRAKYNVQIVSSIKYYDIDLNKTSSEGARLLREYLDFAENSTSKSPSHTKQKDNDFINDIYNYLVDAGYDVDKNVGSSNYTIDLAVKHPSENKYVLAIECDGEKYLNSKSTRDRDRLREEVLAKLGWKYYRVWSTDWFRNNRVEKKRLVNAIKDAIKCPLDSEKQEDVNIIPHFREYDKYDIPKDYMGDYSELIELVVDKESPIAEEWLLKRMLHLFNKTSITKAVRDEFKQYRQKARNVECRNGFLYKKNQTYFEFRMIDKSDREPKYIAVEELASGMDIIIRQNMELSKDSLYKIMSNRIGYTRTAESIVGELDKALQLLKKSGKITINNDRIILK